MTATFEIYRYGAWQPAAVLTPVDEQAGLGGACRFEYLDEYAAENAGPGSSAAAGLSCRYPADFQQYQLDHWPSFVLDLLPGGYGRRQWLEQLNLQDGPAAEWPLLLRGAAYPPGNVRVAEAVAAKNPNTLAPAASGDVVPMKDHPGFARADVISRNEAFVEYAFQQGIHAAGASDVQGVAPKLLLALDQGGAWHAEGRLADEDVQSHWLMKRPRGDRAADRKVLRNEAAYMRVAGKLGLKVFAELKWEEDNLFVPRFDRRVCDGKVERYGMESLYSAAGVAEYGARVSHETLCNAIETYCTEPEADLIEYIKRDIVNVVLGNKDNHGRNTALLRCETGIVKLAPLFDFAPMYLDPEGIARVCRWPGIAEYAGDPEWAAVVELFPGKERTLRAALRDFGRQLRRLPDIMRVSRVDDDIIERCDPFIETHSRQLLELQET
ncbi:MAG: type II toxin-antitoxin system HipA family toxin [Gammaproteobacteria bacterium]|nr:type II toxin-antitoxin system HipA family toxin [Gammaproteobacteria bacterium]MYA36689.1 type II toxin-antitoxin system HipA family toxin [Gammaproteobacteria bacterium]MYE28297.1 type II toxin-antitoxin system HipA family toxin [Gammaproteobacteria bacterium]MYH84979.1 type II toxin-antitoxin system HipA family toxin [Gammaproteobacteria bacterium]MYI02382.1 type II toxin-antitoxin system HipA family toxin [Gammaproteobacteria bacterium]